MGDAAWKVLLKKYHAKLRTGVLVSNFLPALRPLLTDVEYSCVDSNANDLYRVDELVKILLTKDDSTFEGFCVALEKNGYRHWANRLRGKDVDPTTSDGIPTPTGVGRPVIGSLQQAEVAGGANWTLGDILSYLANLIKGMKSDCPVFGILVVGETGTGKSTLINNLVGQEIVKEGHSLTSETSSISKYEMDVEGVPIALYDSPGLGDTRGDRDPQNLQEMKGILKSGAIHLVIYCLKLSETRIRESLIITFLEYKKIGVKWEHTVIALTFADAIPVPKEAKKKPDYTLGKFFIDRLAEMQFEITRNLVERVRVSPEVASEIISNPSTSDPDELLPNGERWFVPFWLHILDLLSPSAAMQYMQATVGGMTGSTAPTVDQPPPDYNSVATTHDVAISGVPKFPPAGSFIYNHTEIVQNVTVTPDPNKGSRLEPQDEERLIDIMDKKISHYAKQGAKRGAIVGAIVGIVGTPVGMLIGSAVGAAIGAAGGSAVGVFKSLFTKVKALK